MTPIYRNIAIAAALVAVPAALTAAASSERVRALPARVGGRVRDWWDDDNIEANLRRLAQRLDDLTDDIDARFSSAEPQRRSMGLWAAIIGIAVIVPAAIAGLAGRDKTGWLDGPVGSGGDVFDGPDEDGITRDLAGLTDRLDTLNADLDRQRESNFDAVTKAARDAEA